MGIVGRSVVTVAAVALLVGPSLHAQGRGRTTSGEPLPPQPAGTSPQTGSGTRTATPAPGTSSAGVSIQQRNVALRRSQIDALSKQLASTSGKKPSRFGSLGGMLNGDQNREAAAKQLLEADASREAARGMTTIVVIGGEADLAKVQGSFPELQRDIVLMFVDDGLSDDTTDNSALRGGMAGKVTGVASNMWVYLPSSGNATSRKPNQTLSTKVATQKLWTGIFASNGDVPVEAQRALDGGQGTSGSQASASPAPAAGGAARAAGSFAEGDVLGPKIAGVRLMATPDDAGKVAATLARADEVVVVGAEQNGYVNVQSPAASGWVKVSLMQKK